MADWLITILVYLALQVVFVLVLQTFPNLLGSALTKKVEHSFDLKLEKAKAEMQSAYSTIKTSTDLLVSGYPEYRAKTIASVEALWGAVLATQKEFSDVILIHDIVLPDEIDAAVKNPHDNEKVFAYIKDYRDEKTVTRKLQRLEEMIPDTARLFGGDRLWLIFFVTRAVLGRLGVLMEFSIKNREYKDWRNDSMVTHFLPMILSSEVIESSKRRNIGGIDNISNLLQAEFLKEARKVMSGSEALASGLSDLQAIVKLQHEQIAAERAKLT